MNVSEKLVVLADAAKYDVSCASSGSERKGRPGALGSTQKMGICHSFTPDGRCVSLLKILLTNYCIFDCQYCVNRITSDVRRARFSTDEVVRLTLEFYRRNYIEGLFLSSGIIQSADYTMEQLVVVARQLREEHDFAGYIHLKTIPGADPKLVEQAGRFADRLSVNIELPTHSDLERLAPEKRLGDIHATMAEVKEKTNEAEAERRTSRFAPRFAPAGQSTQIIVGATESTDAKILATTTALYRQYRLRRVYYSAFSPIPHADARLPVGHPPLVREHRLYEADWLLRFYGFEADELVTEADQNLSLDIDPKLAWALANRNHFPVDVNRAPRRMLLRVPGIGVKSVSRILQIRRHHRVRTVDLVRLGVAMKRARAFIVTADGHKATRLLEQADLGDRWRRGPRQLALFDVASAGGQAEF